MRKLMLVLAGCLMVICCAPATIWASSINYNVNFVVGAGSVGGFIQTDGAVGSLATANITDWNLLLNDGVSSFDLLGPTSGSNSALDVFGTSFTATATNLLFDFSNSTGSFVLFQNPNIGSSINWFCVEGIFARGCGHASSISVTTSTSANTQALSETGVQVVGTSGTSTVPEPATLTLFLSGMVALILFRRNS